MNIAFACLFMFAGCSLIWLASHGLQATTPWEAFQTITDRLGSDG